MGYYPLDFLNNYLGLDQRPERMLDYLKIQGFCDKDATLEEFEEYVYSLVFFSPLYKGKFAKWNRLMIFDRKTNHFFVPKIPMRNFMVRKTEWKDVNSASLVLHNWSKFKMAYKIDNEFFHEIKQTENMLITYEMFEKLPFKTFYVDLSEVKNIADINGAFIHIIKEDEQFIGVNIYMVGGSDYTYYSFYSWFRFENKNEEIEFSKANLPKSDFTKVEQTEIYDEKSFIEALNSTEYKIVSDYDPRGEIITAIYQIMNFIAVDASDVVENPHTKQTYKPSDIVKNKFSEVRMWDVGYRYGKAIKVAKKEFEKAIKEHRETETKKGRKPVRPHIRRAHWQRYHVGKGRKDTKTVWIGAIYVCGNTEIPVTIRKIKK